MADEFPEELRYTESDEWVRRAGDEMVCGITAYAAEQLGDIVFIQAPEIGATFDRGDAFGEIESVKAVSDLNCPLAGEVLSANELLDETPGLINDDPYGRGWIVRLRPRDAADFETLLDATGYRESTEQRH